MAEKPQRQLLQFSLRSLLVLVVIIAVPLGRLMNKIREPRNAVAALKSMGCSVPERQAIIEQPAILRWLRKLLREDDSWAASRIVGNDSQITDAGLAELQALPQLTRLELAGTRVTDAGLAHLEPLSRVQWLFLDCTDVTDAGLVHLRGLTQLQLLTLARTRVTDAGVRALKQALPGLYIDH